MINSNVYRFFAGWDTAKEKLNYCVRDINGTIIAEGEVQNSSSSIRTLISRLIQSQNAEAGQWIHCVENTGLYCHPLLRLCAERDTLCVWLEDPLQLNRSLGRQKNKTDIIDARNIAEYCWLHHRKAQLYQLPSRLRQQVDFINKMRLRLVRQKQALSTSLNERKAFILDPLDTFSVQLIEQQIQSTAAAIKKLENRLEQIIHEDIQASRSYTITRSVLGFGPKNTLTVMAITGLFEAIPTA